MQTLSSTPFQVLLHFKSGYLIELVFVQGLGVMLLLVGKLKSIAFAQSSSVCGVRLVWGFRQGQL